MVVWSGGERFAYLSDEVMAAHTACQPRSVASVRSASHRKILDLLRSFLVQSWDETARFNNLLARLSILLVRRRPHLPHLLLRPCELCQNHAEFNYQLRHTNGLPVVPSPVVHPLSQ